MNECNIKYIQKVQMLQINFFFYRIKKLDLEKEWRENDGCKYLLM